MKLQYITSLSEIAGKRVSLVYVPATATDQYIINDYGTIYNVPFPNLLVKMRPELQIDGEMVVTGTHIGLGLGGQSVQTGFLRPGTYDPLNPVWEFTNKPLLSGNRYNISITTQRTSLVEMNKLAEALEDSAIGMLPNAQMTDDMIDETLRISGMYYFGLVDETTSCISKRLNIVAVSHSG